MTSQIRELPISEIGQDVIDLIGQDLTNFSLGFVKLQRTRQGDAATLAGSGTLVRTGNTHAILTADHVIAELPREDEMGLVLSRRTGRHTVRAQELDFVRIAHGANGLEGPDIGAVILPPDIASSLAAKKSFFNLEGHRDKLLHEPLDIKMGIWVLLGFVAERSKEEAGTGRYSKIMSFPEVSLCCTVNPPFEKGNHDYFDVPVSFKGRPDVPQDFQGMSGGGLWQVSLERGAKAHGSPQPASVRGPVLSRSS